MTPEIVAAPDKAVTLSKRLWVARVLSCASGAVLQILGLYAGIVTFGVWTTLSAYAVGALTVVVQQVILARSSP